MKKGQIQIIFTWIFVLILIGFILIYGIKTVKKTQDLGNEAVIINFFKNLDSRINTYYYLSKDSNGVEEFSLTSDVKCVCFTKDDNLYMNSLECGDDKEDYLNNLKKYSNVFLFSDKNYQQDRMNVTFVYLEDGYNPTCIEVDGGLLKLKLENIGIKGVNISNA